MTRWGRVVTFSVAASVLLLIGSCSSAPSPESSPESSPSPSTSSPTLTATPARSAPPAAACYRLDYDDLLEASNPSSPMSCGRRHNAQTVFVGRLAKLTRSRTRDVDSGAVQRQLARFCPPRVDAFVGGTPQTRDLSRFFAVWFTPTIDEVERGADWFECGLVALASNETLADLPPRPRLRGVLNRPEALDDFGLCGTAAPGAIRFQRVICSEPHAWKALVTLPLTGQDYPGERVVRLAGDSTCRDRVRDALGFSVRFQYGWEWPTRDQWKRGQRYGFCWMPS